MENPEKKSTRIGRIKQGEEIIVKIISEELQEAFHKINDLIDDCKRAHEEAHEKDTPEAWEKYQRADYAADLAKLEFRFKVRCQYKIWGEITVGIRDGYALVKCGEGGHGEALIKKILGI